MLQKAVKIRLFAFKTLQLRSLSAPAPNLLRSAKFCYVCIGEKHRPSGETLRRGFNHFS